MPEAPRDLQQHPTLFMMRSGVAPVWRLRDLRERSKEVEVPISPRFISDEMKTLKRAAVAGLGIASCPAMSVAKRSDRERYGGTARLEGRDSTLTALMPNGNQRSNFGAHFRKLGHRYDPFALGSPFAPSKLLT